MSIAGLNDSIRCDRPLSERVVWHTLESHANGARCWAMTHAEIAAELFISKKAVDRAVAALIRDGIIRTERHSRRKTVFHMLRSYPKQQDHFPGRDDDESGRQKVAQTDNAEAEFGGQNVPDTLEFGGQKVPLNPTERIQQASGACTREAVADDSLNKKAGMVELDGVMVPGHYVKIGGILVDPTLLEGLKPFAPRSHIERNVALIGSPGSDGTEHMSGFPVSVVMQIACERARIKPAFDQLNPVRRMLKRGLEPAQIYAAIEKATRRASYEPPRAGLAYFEKFAGEPEPQRRAGGGP